MPYMLPQVTLDKPLLYYQCLILSLACPLTLTKLPTIVPTTTPYFDHTLTNATVGTFNIQ